MSKRSFLRSILLGALACAGLTGCTVKSTETPELSGPSEFGLSFTITAAPDSITWDGGSQTAVVVSAFDSTGSPRPNVSFKLDMLVGGVPADFGTLSNKALVTGSDGRATSYYTAPSPLPPGSDTPSCSGVTGGCVQIAATPIGTDFQASNTRTAAIRLVPMGTILPPASTPSASFVFNPGSPKANEPVAFDATASCNDASAGTCSPNGLTYSWDFGDGYVGAGRTTQHSYGLARTHNVVLTVTNDRGRQATASKPITIGAGVLPTANFVYSPTTLTANVAINFDASTSVPGPGHLITNYRWNWGDGTLIETTSPYTTHTYTAPGTYVIVLTVFDEAGQQGIKTQNMTIAP